MSTQLGPASMNASHNDFFDLEEVETLAKRKLPKQVKPRQKSAFSKRARTLAELHCVYVSVP